MARVKSALKLKFAPYQDEINTLTNHENTRWSRAWRPTDWDWFVANIPDFDRRFELRRTTIARNHLQADVKRRNDARFAAQRGIEPVSLWWWCRFKSWMANSRKRRAQRLGKRTNRRG